MSFAACKMSSAATCRAEPKACVTGTDVAEPAVAERWFVGLLGAAIGPRDRHGELCAPAVGVFLSCHHPVEPNDPVWNALHEQLELHHPGQCCPDCKRSWHYVSKVDSDAGLASESFSVLLPLDQVHPLMARLVRADLRALFEAASAQALASLELGTTQSGIAAGAGVPAAAVAAAPAPAPAPAPAAAGGGAAAHPEPHEEEDFATQVRYARTGLDRMFIGENFATSLGERGAPEQAETMQYNSAAFAAGGVEQWAPAQHELELEQPEQVSHPQHTALEQQGAEPEQHIPEQEDPQTAAPEQQEVTLEQHGMEPQTVGQHEPEQHELASDQQDTALEQQVAKPEQQTPEQEDPQTHVPGQQEAGLEEQQEQQEQAQQTTQPEARAAGAAGGKRQRLALWLAAGGEQQTEHWPACADGTFDVTWAAVGRGRGGGRGRGRGRGMASKATEAVRRH